ncbi:MAG: flagellar hook capping FlgD N-terminal domain-containing protein [Bacillota bacterium]|nr:flagellar hook capping FlgD N-terminal domain-containing protein [Bacillota bacterium]
MVEVNAAGSSGAYSSQSGSVPNKNMEMGGDMFLQLLVTQMRYQDPFSGGQDMGDFMSQVAQFTLLERVVKLQQTLENFAASQAPIQALNLLNKVVEITGENGETVKGEVTAVRFQEGLPLLKVNEKEYPLKALNWVKGSSDAGE